MWYWQVGSAVTELLRQAGSAVTELLLLHPRVAAGASDGTGDGFEGSDAVSD